MCVQRFSKIILLSILPLLAGCGPIDSIFPSAVTYNVNARANGISLDEFSIVRSNVRLQPYFEEAVSADPDVTALTVFLRNSAGEIAGWKVIYTLDPNAAPIEQETEAEPEPEPDNEDEENENNEDETEPADDAQIAGPQPVQNFNHGEERIIRVRSLDNNLPYFPLPEGLPVGRYTLVFQVMSGRRVLFTTESAIFYLADTTFSFTGINVHQGGISDNPHIIPRGTIIMLEAELDYDSRHLDPYIVWHSGRNIIHQGRFSNGAGTFLWQVPEQAGLFSINAEAFPAANRRDLAGYTREISLIASSQNPNIRRLPTETADLLHLYLFDGSLHNNKTEDEDFALRPLGDIPIRWMGVNGTFGLAAGAGNAFALPSVPLSNDEDKSWKLRSRFKPLNDGTIFSVQFGTALDVMLILHTNDNNLILTLNSGANTVSDIIDISERSSFITTEIVFSTLFDGLYASLNIIDFGRQTEQETKTIGLTAELDEEYNIFLGSRLINMPEAESNNASNARYTAIWDEFALFAAPVPEIVLEIAASRRNMAAEEPDNAEMPEETDELVQTNELAEDESAEETLTRNEYLDESDYLISDVAAGF